MADKLNPFLSAMDEDDMIEDEIEKEPVEHNAEGNNENVPELNIDVGVTLDQVAAKLLKDNFILTALELHTELVESGRELPRLRDFFSNPSNFERLKPPESSPPGLPRTSSCQTFDSLDFARYSDDGDRQENDKVAVLEFELRKAQDMIKSLRATLTKTAETELSTPESPADQLEDFANQEHIREYEKRALNFLVNEYMLTNDYKITSVTFAEENEDQDFEDWDDVGLNMPKPPSLLHLYRDYAQHAMPSVDTKEFGVGVNFDEAVIREKEKMVENIRMELTLKMGELEDQITSITKENTFYVNQFKHMERELEASRLMRVSSSTPAVSPINTPQKKTAPNMEQKNNASGPTNVETNGNISEESDVKELEEDEEDEGEEEAQGEEEEEKEVKDKTEKQSIEPVAETCTQANGEATSEEEPTDSETCRENGKTNDQDGAADGSLYETVNEPDITSVMDSMKVEVGSSLQPPDTTVNESSRMENQSLPVTIPDSDKIHDNFEWHPSKRNMSDAFRKALLNTAFYVSQDTRIVNEVSKITDSSGEKVVLMLGRCLPHIVPNVLLAKREELIPLILCTASLHPDANERDQLLNILFNLIKRPDLEQRQMILTGCVAFAQHVGPTRVESELLPQCWEQINHRFAERRLLVSEACGALAPYLPNEIRSSLVLSMLMQMLQEDKMEEVRESVVRSLGLLIGFIDDQDRYQKASGLLQSSLNDSSERVVRAAQNVFLPSFALWATELGRLESDLISSFVSKLEELIKIAQNTPGTMTTVPTIADRAKFVLLTETLTLLIPELFCSVLQTGPFASKTDSFTDAPSYEVLSTRFPKPRTELMDLVTIIGDKHKVSALVHLYEEYIGEEWYEPWETYIWIAGEFVPQLLNILNAVDVTSPTIVSSMSLFFRNLCRTFGRTFAMSKVKPKFHSVLNIPDDQLVLRFMYAKRDMFLISLISDVYEWCDLATDFGASRADTGDAVSLFQVSEAQVASGQTALTKCTVPVYVAGILGAFNQEADRKQLATFLQELLCTLSLCHASLESLRAAFTELSADSDNHDLLLTVLWDGVVHTSAHVRTTAAKMFEHLIKGVSETLVSTRVIPALVTLASDPEISVRIATVPAFGIIMESVTQREMLDKVHMQFMTFMDDPMYKDQHALHVELIRTFAKVGPNAEPRFRDDFVLPRLAILATQNNHNTNDTRRMDIATQLFDAYSALSCCFINNQLVQESMLPGLRALHADMTALAPDHAPIVASMIKEFEDKVDTNKVPERGGTTPANSPSQAGKHGTDDVRSMLNKFKGNHPKFSNIFKKS